MEEVLDIYKQPYNKAYPVVCMDESSKQQIKDKREKIPMKAGSPEKYDTEYERNGTSNIFMAFEPLSGHRVTKVTDRRTKLDWAHYIRELVDHHYADAKKVILVMDNLNTHKGASLYEAFDPKEAKRILDRLEIHYTPKHGSWLNMAELELSCLSRQCLNRRIASQKILKKEVAAWTKDRNEKQCKVNWQFTTDDARIKLKKLYPVIEYICQN